jgi:3-polyprenyl-4-hydroxybenzoate decarboxylase
MLQRMAARSTAIESEIRAKAIADLLASGATRMRCLQFASETWGIGTRMGDDYIARARELLRANWTDVDRQQMVADLLTQYASLQEQARDQNHLAVALGCINGAARLAQLVS